MLPLPYLITQQILNFMHSIVYDYAPVSLQGEFPINQLNSEYQLRNNEDFLIPRINLESIKRFPFYKYPTLWNDLSPELKSLNRKNEFKYKIKSSFLEKLKDFRCNKLFCYVCSSANIN